MKYIVCTDTIFDFFNGRTELFHFFDEVENIYISTITLGEIHYNSLSMKNSSTVSEISNDFCQLLHVINIDEQIAKKYGELKNKYPSFSDNKLWICASSIISDCVIVSNDSEYNLISEIILKTY